MSTPSGTTQDLETALATVRDEHLRLLSLCADYTAEQAALGFTAADACRWTELQILWADTFDIARVQLDTALHIIDMLYAARTAGVRNA
jgi:hypothetical protein